HEPDQQMEQPGGIVAPDVAGDAAAGHPADARADQLDRRHQGIAEQQRPAEAVAELRTGLGVGGNAAGIVVGSAGDEPGPEGGENAAAPFRRPAGFRYFGHRRDSNRGSLRSASMNPETALKFLPAPCHWGYKPGDAAVPCGAPLPWSGVPVLSSLQPF